MNETGKIFKTKVVGSVVFLLTVMAIYGTFFCHVAFAQPPQETGAVKSTMTSEQANVTKFGLVAASIAFGLGAIGAGIAISHVGAAAMGAIAEKPQLAGQALIFVALAEGLVVFGFITALM